MTLSSTSLVAPAEDKPLLSLKLPLNVPTITYLNVMYCILHVYSIISLLLQADDRPKPKEVADLSSVKVNLS